MSGASEEIKPCPHLRISKCAYRPGHNGVIPKSAELEHDLSWSDLTSEDLEDVSCVFCLVAQDLAGQAECYENLCLRSMDD